MTNDLLYIGIILFVFLIILGLYLSQESSLNINEKNQILMENFSPQVSSTNAQKKGASQLYKWGMPEDNVSTKTKRCKKQDDDIPSFTPKPIEENCAPFEEINCNDSNKDEQCGNCDILTHKDINKYVLKSSVPPCPDSSKFATKNMLKTCPDMSKYILKSEIPKCEKIDKSKYILKSEIPACPKCPICPVCPTCPTCPKPQPCKTINQYKIQEHPDMANYVSKKDLKKYVENNNLCELYAEEEGISSNNEGTVIDNNGDEIVIDNNGNEIIIDKNGEEYIINNNGQKIKKNKKNIKDKCTYPNMLDRIFASGSNLKTNNMKGMYAGDNLYARF